MDQLSLTAGSLGHVALPRRQEAVEHEAAVVAARLVVEDEAPIQLLVGQDALVCGRVRQVEAADAHAALQLLLDLLEVQVRLLALLLALGDRAASLSLACLRGRALARGVLTMLECLPAQQLGGGLVGGARRRRDGVVERRQVLEGLGLT